METETKEIPAEQAEEDRILSYLSESIGDLLLEEDIPTAIYLLPIPSGITFEEDTLIERRGQRSAARWLFVLPPQVDTASLNLSAEKDQELEELAERLGIKKTAIIGAAIGAKALLENTQGGSIALKVDGGPEVVKLTKIAVPPSNESGLVAPNKIIHALQYYSSFGLAGDRPIRTLIAHGELEETTFQTVFPPLLVFQALVDLKHQTAQASMKAADTEVNPHGLVLPSGSPWRPPTRSLPA